MTRWVPSRLRDPVGFGLVHGPVHELLDVFIEQLEVGMNEADRIVEFVRDAGHELPERLHLLGLKQLRLSLV